MIYCQSFKLIRIPVLHSLAIILASCKHEHLIVFMLNHV